MRIIKVRIKDDGTMIITEKVENGTCITAADERLINVIQGDLAKAILGFMEGKEESIREGIAGIKEKTNPDRGDRRSESEIISEQIETIIFSSGMKYGPATALALLALADTDDIEVVNESIRLLEMHKLYLKSEHPIKKNMENADRITELYSDALKGSNEEEKDD